MIKDDLSDYVSLSAKSSPAKLGRKLFVVDENRRSTYDNISEQQPMLEPESVFDIFESETRQLVDVCYE